MKNNEIYPQNKQFQLIKRVEWILPHAVKRAPIFGMLILYNERNRMKMTDYTTENMNKSKVLMLLSKNQNYISF